MEKELRVLNEIFDFIGMFSAILIIPFAIMSTVTVELHDLYLLSMYICIVVYSIWFIVANIKKDIKEKE